MAHEIALAVLADHRALGRAQPAQLDGEDQGPDQGEEGRPGGGQRHDPLRRGELVHGGAG
jgi:hypothetical protein